MQPKKILHVTNRAEKHDGRRFYTLAYKINNGFIRNGHNVYWFSDRDVAKTSTIFPSAKAGRLVCNRKLIEVCKNFRPEVIALAHADIVKPETLQMVKKFLPDVRVFQYNIDALSTRNNIQRVLSKLSVVEHTFMTTAGPALSLVSIPGVQASFMPNPVDPSIDIHRNWEIQDLPYDLLFVGSYSDWLDPESLRAQAFKRLPLDPPGMRVLMSHNIWGSELVAALGASKMAVCFNQKPAGEMQTGKGSKLYLCVSDRISLCMGNGLLSFTDKSFDSAVLYGQDALVEVSCYEEFREKAKFFQNNDDARRKVARKGYELSHKEFNERLVTRYMLETVYGEKFTYDYQWPTERY